MQLDFINTKFLRALDALPSSLTNNLESSAPPSQPITSAAALLASSAVGLSSAENDSVRKVKKVRMARVPAGVVPGVTPPPDPERWLKRSERSSFGQGTRRRKGAVGGGATQGSMDIPVGNSSNAKGASAGHGKSKKKK